MLAGGFGDDVIFYNGTKGRLKNRYFTVRLTVSVDPATDPLTLRSAFHDFFGVFLTLFDLMIICVLNRILH